MLFVVAGGITRVWRSQLPAPLNLWVALMLRVSRLEAENPHEIRIVVQGEDGERLTEVQGAMQVGETQTEVGEDVLVPVAIRLTDVAAKRYGAYSVEILVDGDHKTSLQFRVLHPDQKPGSGLS